MYMLQDYLESKTLPQNGAQRLPRFAGGRMRYASLAGSKYPISAVFFCCLLTLALLLAGCRGSEGKESPQPNEVAHLQIAATEGALEGTATESAKGLTYGFDGDKLFPHIRMKEGEHMPGRCFIRNTNPQIPVRSIPVTWSVIQGHLRSGRFSIDMTYPSGMKVGDWQICFFMGNAHFYSATQKIHFSADRVLRPIRTGQEYQWELPYLSPWVTLEQQADGVWHAPKASLRPQGAFLRIQLQNNSGRQLKIKGVRIAGADPSVQGSPFVWEGEWHASATQSAAAIPLLSEAPQDFHCALPEAITLPVGKTSGWYGVWVMPVKATDTYSSNIYVEPATIEEAARTPWWLYHTPLEGRSGSSGPASGRSYTFQLRFRQLIPTRLQNWMQEIEDNRLICKMSIPGTHDTAADTGNAWVKTQEKSIKEQLNSGIRFFDIRLVHDKGVLKLCHTSWVFNKTLTEDVLRTTADFLRDHPSETVIMTLKRDHDYDKDGGMKYKQALTRALEANPKLTAYMAGNFRGNFTMKDLRGKMLLISREGWFFTKSGQIDSWPDNGSFSTTIKAYEGGNTPLHVEDHYKARAGDKVNYVATNVRKANAAFDSPNNEWFITFSSYTGPLGGGTPYDTTGYVDPHVLNILKGNETFRTCGILLFNFAGWFDYGGKKGNGLTRAVINLNGIPQPED